ncbi:MAG: helix-turn-helix domain-containing protein [Nitrospiraceae bacterium]|nr:helix-turn-helix domain-containing protein [Nitrospiraceae bacterium]
MNQLRERREQLGLSQGELARQAEITRQAVSSIESNAYLPTTAVALKLASVLGCRVEDLFRLAQAEDVLEGTLVGALPAPPPGTSIRVKVSTVGKRTIVRALTSLGEVLSFTVPADGLLVGGEHRSGGVVSVQLSRDRRAIEQEISVAGCDPAIFLAGEHLRRQKAHSSVVGWSMGSMAALQALHRGEVHVAGLHLVDPATGESNLPYLRRFLRTKNVEVVTFAAWEEGLLVRPGNPKSVRGISDLALPSVKVVNREEGSGARLLLDQRLRAEGIDPRIVEGYDRIVWSHVEVARAVATHQADAGVGTRSAAQLLGLDFVPLQVARYDLVVPKSLLKSHPTLVHLFDTLASRSFRAEIGALEGYDTTDTGKRHAL